MRSLAQVVRSLSIPDLPRDRRKQQKTNVTPDRTEQNKQRGTHFTTDQCIGAEDKQTMLAPRSFRIIGLTKMSFYLNRTAFTSHLFTALFSGLLLFRPRIRCILFVVSRNDIFFFERVIL